MRKRLPLKILFLSNPFTDTLSYYSEWKFSYINIFDVSKEVQDGEMEQMRQHVFDCQTERATVQRAVVVTVFWLKTSYFIFKKNEELRSGILNFRYSEPKLHTSLTNNFKKKKKKLPQIAMQIQDCWESGWWFCQLPGLAALQNHCHQFRELCTSDTWTRKDGIRFSSAPKPSLHLSK